MVGHFLCVPVPSACFLPLGRWLNLHHINVYGLILSLYIHSSHRSLVCHFGPNNNIALVWFTSVNGVIKIICASKTLMSYVYASILNVIMKVWKKSWCNDGKLISRSSLRCRLSKLLYLELQIPEPDNPIFRIISSHIVAPFQNAGYIQQFRSPNSNNPIFYISSLQIPTSQILHPEFYNSEISIQLSHFSYFPVNNSRCRYSIFRNFTFYYPEFHRTTFPILIYLTISNSTGLNSSRHFIF